MDHWHVLAVSAGVEKHSPHLFVAARERPVERDGRYKLRRMNGLQPLYFNEITVSGCSLAAALRFEEF